VLQHIDGVPIEFLEAINSAADLPDLAIILTADPAVTASRIARRGAHSRFETGISASRAEAELYREATARLADRDVPVLTVDTTVTATAQLVTLLGGRIAQLAGVPNAGPATE
jgi:dTMP kinase